MSKKATRAVISAVILVGALALLLFTTMKEDVQAFKHVDEVAQNPRAWYGKHLDLHGYVTGTVMVRPNTLEYQFDVQNNGQTIKASYTGVVPDTFKTGAEVVLKGRLNPEGFQVEHDGVMAKCPSKYTPSNGPGPSGKSGN
jgi:cytochrome c-type biogenesis protein CcmE